MAALYIMCIYILHIRNIPNSCTYMYWSVLAVFQLWLCVCACMWGVCSCVYMITLVHLSSIHPYHYMFMCTLFFLYIIYVIWTIHYEYHKRKHYTYISIALCIWIMPNKWLSYTLYTLETSQISSIGVSLQY